MSEISYPAHWTNESLLDQSETAKAHERRKKEGFFDKYCQGDGIDIGSLTHNGLDARVAPNSIAWGWGDGDATHMEGAVDEFYDFVYSSHLIEHLSDPWTGLKNQWRILKPNGYLIMAIPHRDLYERQTKLPSKWNGEHKYYWLLDESDPPDTLSALDLIKDSLSNYKIIEAKVCNTCTNADKLDEHGNGEYSIEIVVQKLK